MTAQEAWLRAKSNPAPNFAMGCVGIWRAPLLVLLFLKHWKAQSFARPRAFRFGRDRDFAPPFNRWTLVARFH